MTRVIHTGDTHIGYQQYNTPERRRDFLRAFRQVAEDAVSDDVDAVIHAGDLFHDRRPGLVDLQGTVEVLRTLQEADIPFLAVVGNHEGKRDAQWLDLFEDLGLATRLGAEPHVIDDVAFYGLDFVPRSRREDLAYEFESTDADHRALVSHGLFEPFAHADWDTETVLEQATVDFDAMLLGDNHAPDTAEVADTWVTYCGSTERASASERDDRGYNIVTFESEGEGEGEVAITRRGLPATREFVFVDVDLEDGEGIDRVRDRVREYDLEDAVVIVTVDGGGEPITPAAVEEFAIDRDALIARVNDHREIDTDEDVSVSFADPDDAVRERIRDLGLSDAARDIDRTVRDGDVVDANVRETVERRVREALEDDREAFRSAVDGETERDVQTVADALDERDGDGNDEDDGNETEDVADPATADSSDSSESDVATDASETDTSSDVDDTDDDTPDDADEQVSMGDFA
ncbi:DNA double-strand break repair protein Mre11 [Halobacteria archaeon AArc-m2/3/4]|uniref:DNA double-strand break repair protein Mre11 n=1 Tax=Natronoglomus mannanivorans TaxID=2979990 RepID=A0AAP2YVM7_9EURY|nr:DNA double-strand break repair protein Mre11 [Halobacteria archaeon AArc-xg1-1]MCU4971708.1 DNA double-strand break repair protein Mre11 [Halobacteria archaeon AArc-m2/3/4]